MNRASTGKQIAVLIGFVALCQAAGLLGALSTVTGGSSWFAGLVKPPFNPPGWVFAPVWTTLYALMGISAWLVWKASAPRRAWVAFGVQLALNAAWTPMFFGAHRAGLALVIIVALLGAIVWTIVEFRRASSAAAWLLAPYLAWVGFATVLNGSIWWLNRSSG